MSKHIPAQEQPLKAAAHSGSSPDEPSRAPAQETGGVLVTPTPPSVNDSEPPLDHEQIAVRAFEIWLDRGRPAGTDVENWCEAERQLRSQSSEPQKPSAPVNPVR